MTTVVRWSRPALTAVAVAAAALVLARLVLPPGRPADVVFLVAVWGASLLGAVATRATPRGERLVPALITAGLASNAIGETSWIVHQWAGHAPDVSFADVGYIGSYVFLAAGMLVITLVRRGERSTIDIDAAIDALTVVVVSVIVIWSAAVRGIVDDSSLPALHRAVFAVYPIADGVLIALAVRILAGRRTRAALGKTFVVGVAFWLYADITYLVTPAEGFVLATTDGAWMVGAFLMGRAAWRPGRYDIVEVYVGPPSRRGQVVRLVGALLPLLVVPTLLVVADARGRSVDPVTALVALLAVVAVTCLRTARLLHSEWSALDELARARDAALDASRAKSEFLATMSHEIRTPMNGVIGLNDLLLTTSLTAQQQQYAEGVRGAGHALLGVINEILDFSKIESGHLELEEIDFEVCGLVDGVAELVAEPARGQGLELLAYCSPDLPAVLRGDPAKIRQVLLNLAGNAVKFTATGEVVVRAGLEEREGEPATVRFEVSDTGIGLAQDDSERLFEAFSQADSSTTRRFGGTGLGLAISRHLVEAMGGRIGVDSVLGQGSVFWFTLPLVAGDAPVETSPPAPLAGLRALVVDDNATNRTVLRDQLRHWGLEVDTADGSWAGLRQFLTAADEGRPYDLGVLDLCMPDMDGLELARRISRTLGLGQPRLVLMTSGPDVNRADADAADLATTLRKPVQMARLRAALEEASPAPLLPPAPVTTSALKVLVVDDSEVNQIVAAGILRHLGYDVEVVDNGADAVAAVRREAFHAVLMDVQMPVLDGYAATEQVRVLEAGGRRTPIIAMTASASREERARCLAAGMDDYLTKPMGRQEVAAKLSEWVVTA